MREPQYQAAESPDRLMEFLFNRSASQRKSTTNGYKDHWNEIVVTWAIVCMHLVSLPQLQNLCATIRIRFGSGVERQAFQALGTGLIRDNGVDEHLQTAAHAGPMATTYNACVEVLQDLLSRTENFRQFESLRQSVAGVRELRDATVTACSLLDSTLAACEHKRPGTAGRTSPSIDQRSS
ncbi:hypothetical protein F5X99DRAFT_423804 [Biscogniauxia marginata]|nr:hypothetical protein F5X99DRAFT_423804 [Biscogniauxia marginata]